MIIGITGTDGAGKGTVVDHLLEKGNFEHCSARALFVDEINRRSLPMSRNQMRLMANELRAKHGDDFLITEYKRRTGFLQEKNYLIESLRAVAEAKTLKELGGVLIAVDADQKIRYERVQQRRSESDHVTFEEFKNQEALEMNDPDPHGMQKAKVIEMADYVIQNNGVFDELLVQVDEVLKKIDELK